MERQDQQSHHVKRVVLPSGKTIEVVYFEPTRPAEPGASGTADRDRTCTSAPSAPPSSSTPSSGRRPAQEHWHVALRCPNCEWHHRGRLRPGTVDMFDEELESGTDELVGDLKQLMRANMAEEIDRFVAALAADAILPEDF